MYARTHFSLRSGSRHRRQQGGSKLHALNHRPHRRKTRDMLGSLQRFPRLRIPPNPIVVDLAELERALVRSQLVHPVGDDLWVVDEDVAFLRVVPALRVPGEARSAMA